MRRVWLGSFVLLALLACAPMRSGGSGPQGSRVPNTAAPFAAAQKTEGPLLSPPLVLSLQERKQQVLAWALRCGPSVSKEDCDVGDATLFNGISCLAGDALSCDAVRLSQDVRGRMWRAPQRVGGPERDAFSRDMALGVLAYLVSTRDRLLASRWLEWIQANGGRLCLESSDLRCRFSPGFWNLFAHVWQYLGLELSDEMKNELVNDELALTLQARLAPLGFPLHLVAVDLLIRQKTGHYSELGALTAAILVERQSNNPLFRYLLEGPSEKVARQVLELCPSRPPLHGRKQWSWERDAEQEAWKGSMGWECVALINLLLREPL